MKITIDTTVDSHEDIRKVLEILHHVVQKKNNTDTTPMMGMFNSEETKTDSTDMMSMFSSQETERKEIPDTPPDFTSLINLRNQEENKEVRTVNEKWTASLF